MLGLLKRIFSRQTALDKEDAEDLRIRFRARYHGFKLLLSANNKALEIMAEMESALIGAFPFGMTFVRSRCTRVSASVFQMVKQINELAPGRYDLLFDRFKSIQMLINPHVRSKQEARQGPLVLPIEAVDATQADLVGPKMAHLGEITSRIGLQTPRGFVITAAAYHRFMKHNDLQTEIDRRLQATPTDRLDDLYSLSTGIQQIIMGAEVPEDLRGAIESHYGRLAKEENERFTVAMRSSALGEDMPGATFAGQYRSELNVSHENIFEAYRQIIASKYGLTAMTYRLNRGIRDEDVAMSVGCLRMVDALSGGVLYSRDPVDQHQESVIIHSVWGLPKSVVDGTTDPDRFTLSRTDPPRILKKEIPEKAQKFVCFPDEGVCRLDAVGEERNAPSLTDAQAQELARLAIRLEQYYGTPQDIEWALSKDGALTLLQCRPLAPQEPSSRTTQADTGHAAVLMEGGSTASRGTAAGTVYRVRKHIDVMGFPDGAILVAEQALPRWATLLSRAQGVITEQGSMAGHLANVAREFGVPALFGLKGALSSLSDGQLITVDADGRRVYEGRVESVLEQKSEPRNLMQGSPVFEALRGAAQHVVPLNLLDPDAPSFKPDSCRTFHDITRFCHEKAVQEMFRFGRDHHFPERSSKQLRSQNVPMKWWVLNLDDGFSQEVDSPYVDLENIVSVPMLALWAGITAAPWEGPPPMDGRGMMSVMFQATTNQDLVLGRRSRFAMRNYFMISRNYCSLNSRFGFHFATVETLVGDHPPENYVSFQFKGGAADLHRRIHRVRFLGAILEDYGFRVDLREDNLIARLEGHERRHMENRLNILGHLTIHTRQLDMIMANPASVAFYKNKLESDLDRLFPFDTAPTASP